MHETPQTPKNTIRLDLSRFGDPAVHSVTLAELDGHAEERAHARAAAAGGTGFHIVDHLVMQSIVKVNDEDVPGGLCVDWKSWRTKTRDVVRAAYDRLNSLPKKELDDFLAQAFGEATTEGG